MKKILILLITFLLTGCTNYKEINNLEIINMIGIDYKNNEYIVTLNSLNITKEIKDNQNLVNNETIYEARGSNISDTISKITLSSPKKIYLEHLDVVIVSEDLAKKGLKNIMDYFIRNNNINKNFTIIVSKINTITDIFQNIKFDSSYPVGNILSSIESSSNINGSITNTTFTKFLSDYYMEGINPVILSITLKDGKALINNLAIFNKDKLVGYLEELDNVGYNFITNKIDETLIKFDCDNTYSSININSSKTKIIHKLDNDKLILDINLSGNIEELNCNLSTSEIKEKTIKKIEEIITNTISKVKNVYNLDIFGFGEFIYKNNINYYNKNKNNYFNKIKINTKINLKLNDLDTLIKIGGINYEQ